MLLRVMESKFGLTRSSGHGLDAMPVRTRIPFFTIVTDVVHCTLGVFLGTMPVLRSQPCHLCDFWLVPVELGFPRNQPMTLKKVRLIS